MSVQDESFQKAQRVLESGFLSEAKRLFEILHQKYTNERRTKDAALCLCRLGDVAARSGQRPTAKEKYKQAYNKNPADPEILASYGLFLLEERETTEAAKLFRAMLLFPSGAQVKLPKAEIYLYLGVLCSMEDNPQKALEMIKRGIELEPENIKLKEALSQLQQGKQLSIPTQSVAPPEANMSTIRCPSCGRENPAHYKFCLSCGAELTKKAQPADVPQNEAHQEGHHEDSMRSNVRCPKCKHTRILHIAQIPDRIEGGDLGITEGAEKVVEGGPFYPWRIARVPTPNAGFWGSKVSAAGLVEAYICRRCGFTEFFTKDVDKIPVDGEFVRELKGADDSDPYR